MVQTEHKADTQPEDTGLSPGWVREMNSCLGTACWTHSTWNEHWNQTRNTSFLPTVNYRFSGCIKIFNTSF